jgi:hypothetical protein
VGKWLFGAKNTLKSTIKVNSMGVTGQQGMESDPYPGMSKGLCLAHFPSLLTSLFCIYICVSFYKVYSCEVSHCFNTIVLHVTSIVEYPLM